MFVVGADVEVAFDSLLDGGQFLVVGAVHGLRWIELVGGGDRLLASVDEVLVDSTNTKVRGVCGNIGVCVWSGKTERVSVTESLFG